MVFTPNDKPALSQALDKWYTLANDLSDTEAVNTANNYVGSEYNGNPNTWDVTRIPDMTSLFEGKEFEHHPLINNWNTKNVVTMDSMFKNSNFNNPINSLPISKFGESVTMSFVVADITALSGLYPDGWVPLPGEEDGIVPARIPKGITITNMTTGQTILDDVVLENYYHPDHEEKLNNSDYESKGFLFTANSNDVLKIESGETRFGEMYFGLSVVAGNEATDFQGKGWIGPRYGGNAENLDELIYLTEKPGFEYTLTIRDTGKNGFQEGSDKTKTIIDGVTVINELTGKTLVTDFKLMSKYTTDGSAPFDTALTKFFAKQGEKLRLKTGDEFFDEMEIDIEVLDKKESFKGTDAENLDKVLDMLPAVTEQNDGVMTYSLKVLLEDTSEDGWQQDKAPSESIKYGFSVENLSTGQMLIDNAKIPSKLDNQNYAPKSLTITNIDSKDTLRFTTGNEHFDEMKITASVVDPLGREFQFFTGSGKIVETLNLTSRLSDFIPMKMTLENYESDKDLVVTYNGLEETVFLNGGKGPYEKQDFNFFVNKYTVYRVTSGALLGENPENAKMTLMSMDPECPFSLTLSGSELDNYSKTGYVCSYNSWNTGKVNNFASMFELNTAFDQPIHRFNTTNVINMSSMFKDSVFNQEINSMKVQYENEAVPLPNYKLTLIDTWGDGWSEETNNNRTIDIGVTLKTKDENGEFVIVRDNNDVPIDNLKLEYRWADGAPPYDLKEINFKSGAKVFYLTTGDEFYEEMVIRLESPDTGFSTTFSGFASENLVDEPIEVTGVDIEPEYWNTKKVQNMSRMFQNNLVFNKPVGLWNTNNVLNMASMFERAYQFNQNISTKLAYEGTQSEYIAWDTLNVTNMNYMMRMINSIILDNGRTDYFVPDFGFWNNGEEIGQSNAPLNWNTTKVTQFQRGFFGCRYFNQNISTKEVTIGDKTYISFDTRNADMFRILEYTESFNNGDERGASTKPLYWNVQSTPDLTLMFGTIQSTVVLGCSYNQPMNTERVTIGTTNPITYTAWDTSNVTRTIGCFYQQTLFNQPLDQWNVSNVTDMSYMFDGAEAFNQNINTQHKVLVTNDDVLPMKLTLIDTWGAGWQEQAFWVDGQLVYPDGTPYDFRTILVGVTLKTRDENGELIIVQDNNGVPIDNLKLNSSIDPFGSVDSSAVGPFDLKEIEFTGSPSAEYFITTGDEHYQDMKIIIESTDESRPFNYTIEGRPAENKTDESIGAISNFTPSKEIVKSAISWDMSSVVDTYAMFVNAHSFDKPIDRWDTNSLSDTRFMFLGATSYNKPMNTKSRVRLLRNKKSTNAVENDIVFNDFTTEKEAIKFAYDAMKVYGRTSFEMGFNGSTFSIRILDKLDTLEEDSTGTFSVGCLSEFEETLFGDLAKDSIDGFSTWNTSSISLLSSMFSRARSFNQEISNWNITNVTSLSNLFQQADSYNQPMSTKIVNKGKEGEYVAWNTANVVNFAATFKDAHSFDQDIENWDVRNGTSFFDMFMGATNFNHHIQDWNLFNATRLDSMFKCAESFNKPLPTAKINDDPYLDTLVERGEPLPMRLTLIDGEPYYAGWLGPYPEWWSIPEGVTLKDQNGNILTDKQGKLIENRRLKRGFGYPEELEEGESYYEKEIDFEIMPDQGVYISSGETYFNFGMTISISSMDPKLPFVKTFESTAAQNLDNELAFLSIQRVKDSNDLWSLANVKNVSQMFAGSKSLDLLNTPMDGVEMPLVDKTEKPLYSTLDYTVEEPPTMDTIYSTTPSNYTNYNEYNKFAFSKEGKVIFTASLPEGENPIAVYFGFSNMQREKTGAIFESQELIEDYTSKVVIDGTEKKTYTINVPATGKTYGMLHMLLEKPRSGNSQVYIDDLICINDNASEETYKKQMSFNQDISSWDVSKVENFYAMFKDNTAFDGNGSNLMDNWLIKKD